jgi:separase
MITKLNVMLAADALQTSTQYVTVILKTSSAISVLLQPSQRIAEKRSREEEEVSRICGKVDRAFEKARRMALKVLEAITSASASSALPDNVEADLREFLLQCVISLEPPPSLPVSLKIPHTVVYF